MCLAFYQKMYAKHFEKTLKESDIANLLCLQHLKFTRVDFPHRRNTPAYLSEEEP